MDKPRVYKELHFVFIVNGEMFFTKQEAENYIKKLEKENNNVRYFD